MYDDEDIYNDGSWDDEDRQTLIKKTGKPKS